MSQLSKIEQSVIATISDAGASAMASSLDRCMTALVHYGREFPQDTFETDYHNLDKLRTAIRLLGAPPKPAQALQKEEINPDYKALTDLIKETGVASIVDYLDDANELLTEQLSGNIPFALADALYGIGRIRVAFKHMERSVKGGLVCQY